jgi:hypothetical protein
MTSCLRTLGALGLVWAATAAGAADHVLEFRFAENNGLIVKKQGAARASHGWGPTELAGLPNFPLQNVNVLFTPVKPQITEADLFAFDPSQVAALLKNQPPFDVNNDDKCFPSEPGWSAHIGDGFEPWVAVLLSKNANPTSQQTITLTDFFQNHPPMAPASDPGGAGSIKAAFLYDHGACAYSLDTYDTLYDLAHQVEAWGLAMMQQFDCCSTATRHYIREHAFIEHQPNAPKDARGGFLMAFSYTLDLHDPAPMLDFCYSQHWQFGLTDGILSLSSGIPWFSLHGPGEAIDKIDPEVQNALVNMVPEQFLAQALDQQSRDVTGGIPCVIGQADNCAIAADVLNTAIEKGGANLGLSDDDVAMLQTVAGEPAQGGGGPTFTGRHNWMCIPQDPDRGVCEYVLRAKRLTVTPNTVNLVWFDGVEPKNSAYALYVAAHAQDVDEDVIMGELCPVQATPWPPGLACNNSPYCRTFPDLLFTSQPFFF